MFFVYTILYAIALVFIAPFEYFRRPSELRGRWLKERFGFIDSNSDFSVKARKKVVWVHAVSVGEAAAAVPFVKKILDLYPETDIVISTVTDTGQKVSKERMGSCARIIYAPFDLPFCAARAIDRIKPDLFIIMETEIWPNIIRRLGLKGVPVALINGRISEKSFRGYLKIKSFIRYVLGYFAVFCMQEELYAERIKLLGAPAEKVSVTGNLKFDIKPPSAVPPWTMALKPPVIVAGSTHEGEEEIILEAYKAIVEIKPEVNLILAPRHPERFSEVEELVKRRNFGYLKRSDLDKEPEAVVGKALILDSIGELSSVYGVADIAVIGGSFIKHGGQNPLEPAFWGKAIICGPHMENFPFIDRFYSEGAAVRAEPESLSSTMLTLLSDSEKISSMGYRALRLYEKDRGSTTQVIKIIEPLLHAKISG